MRPCQLMRHCTPVRSRGDSLFSLDPKNGSTMSRILTYVCTRICINAMNKIIVLLGRGRRDRWTVRVGGAGGIGGWVANG